MIPTVRHADLSYASLEWAMLERRAACEAFDRMVAARPLEPPTRSRPVVVRATAAELALVADQKAGIV